MVDQGAVVVEEFSIPGVGGILERELRQARHILIQERCKPEAPSEFGLLEIPAGKIRAFENIFSCLRREVSEETGLDIVEIQGEREATYFESGTYRVLNYTPFASAQNLRGTYPIMVHVFICRVRGRLKAQTDETQHLRWISLEELRLRLENEVDAFYPMHVDTLRRYLSLHL